MLASPPNECEECGAYWYDNDGHCCHEWKKLQKEKTRSKNLEDDIKAIGKHRLGEEFRPYAPTDYTVSMLLGMRGLNNA